MSNKSAAAYHGATCSGACCANPYGVCAHGRACKFHLKEEAARIKRETEESARLEFEKAWIR
jgi:hypothetical protein